MYSTHLVFATLVAAIASDGSEETSSNGSPVDAWRTVTLPDAFYLMHRSFKTDAGLGDTGECVSIQLSKKDDTTKTAESRVNYWDAETTKWTEKTVCVKLDSSEGSKGDIIQIGDCNAPTTQVKFVYSNYGTCDVTFVSGDDKKCELWVKKGYQHLGVNTDAVASRDDTDAKKSIDKCKEEYKRQCKSQEKYQIYVKDTCSSLSEGPK